MKQEITLFADFNDLRPGKMLRSSLRFLEGQREPVVGERVHLEDSEGNYCLAAVTGIRGLIIDLEPDWDSFRAAGWASDVPGSRK